MKNAIRTAIVLAVLMGAASVGAVVARPNTKAADVGPAIVLEHPIFAILAG